jgi:hypothetical protein
MALTVDTGHLLWVKSLKDYAATPAKLYLASGGGGTTHLLNVRDKTNVVAFAGLVASSVNDPRKWIVRERIVNSLGAESFVKHYMHVMIVGIQYSLLSQIEGGIDFGWNIFSGEVARDHTDHEEVGFATRDYYAVDTKARIYDTSLAACKISWDIPGPAAYEQIDIWIRIDDVDGTNVASGSVGAGKKGSANFTPSNGSHTIGLHIQYRTISVFQQMKGDVWVDAVAQRETNAGDPA